MTETHTAACDAARSELALARTTAARAWTSAHEQFNGLINATLNRETARDWVGPARSALAAARARQRDAVLDPSVSAEQLGVLVRTRVEKSMTFRQALDYRAQLEAQYESVEANYIREYHKASIAGEKLLTAKLNAWLCARDCGCKTYHYQTNVEDL